MSGTSSRLLAVVFTDVVGSTGVRQRLGDRAYAEAIRAHHGAVLAVGSEDGLESSSRYQLD